MKLREAINNFMDQCGDVELEDLLNDTDLTLEIFNTVTNVLITMNIEKVPNTEEMH